LGQNPVGDDHHITAPHARLSNSATASVQDTEAYQRLLDLAADARVEEAIRHSARRAFS
jgi:hypothetical protein